MIDKRKLCSPPSALAVKYGFTKSGSLGDFASTPLGVDHDGQHLPGDIIQQINELTRECHHFVLVISSDYNAHANVQEIDEAPPDEIRIRFGLNPLPSMLNAGHSAVHAALQLYLENETQMWSSDWNRDSWTGTDYRVVSEIDSPLVRLWLEQDLEATRCAGVQPNAQLQEAVNSFVAHMYKSIKKLRKFEVRDQHYNKSLHNWYPVDLNEPFQVNKDHNSYRYQIEFKICWVVPFLVAILKKLQIDKLKKAPPRSFKSARKQGGDTTDAVPAAGTLRRQCEERAVLATRLLEAHKAAGLDGIRALATSLGLLAL